MSAKFLKELVLEFPRFSQKKKKILLDKIDFHLITFCRLRIRKALIPIVWSKHILTKRELRKLCLVLSSEEVM